MPETTTTQAVPSLLRARTCVAVRANPKSPKKTFKQPHRPFLRSRKQRLDWGIVFIYKCAKEIEKLLEYSKSSLSGSPYAVTHNGERALTWP